MDMLRILLLEDNPLDMELIQTQLAQSWADCEFRCVQTREDYVAALDHQSFDLILSDYSLPSFDGITALNIAHERCPEIPFIFVSANLGEEVAIETLRQGATDYVLKQRLEKLPPVAERAVHEARERIERKWIEAERAQLLTRQRQYTSRLRKLANASIDINSMLSLEQTLQLITERAREIVEVHQSVTLMALDGQLGQAIANVSLSDKYASWRDRPPLSIRSNLYSYICRINRPMRLTQAELDADSVWSEDPNSDDPDHGACRARLPLRGLLAAPLTNRNGKNIGLIQLSDKYEGDFTEDDEAFLVQLAQMASVAIENASLYQQSQETNRIKDEFLATLSHELRSPLNPILGWSRLLQNRTFDEATIQRALQTIERNAKLQTHLIEDLLDVSRILQGKLALRTSSVNLISTIEAAIDTMHLAAEARSIAIEFLVAAPDPTRPGPSDNWLPPRLLSDLTRNAFQIVGDPSRLQQIVWNLLSNAIKFTQHGGQVSIQLSIIGEDNGADRGLPSIASQAFPNRYAEIAISDTGKGIKAEFLPHVFDHFRQADASITRVYGGLGLGLAIVRHLVELHGGTIWAESQGENQGATFTVHLPLNPLGVDETQHLAIAPTYNLDGIQAVVVDDEADAREIITIILEEQGVEVISAASASDALEAVKQFNPDVLVSDIGMPEEDGYTLIRKVRALDQTLGKTIPAIALTAYARPEDSNQALAAGYQTHLPKPVEPAELVKIVAGLVGRVGS